MVRNEASCFKNQFSSEEKITMILKNTNFHYSDQLVNLERFICEVTLSGKKNIHFLRTVWQSINCKLSNYIILPQCVGNSRRNTQDVQKVETC